MIREHDGHLSALETRLMNRVLVYVPPPPFGAPAETVRAMPRPEGVASIEANDKSAIR
jgi:hypothetical protein